VRPEADRRRELAAEWDQVVTEIRAQPGFEWFLRPPPFEELLAAAGQGPVVLVNVSDIRSDAILLTPGEVAVVPLPDLTPSAVAEHAGSFLTALDDMHDQWLGPDGQRRREQELFEVLGWLWEALAGPVLNALGITGRANPDIGVQWPRIWWCPAGLLSFLPIHAAGHHAVRSDGVPPTVLDRVVSSYTPTVRALIYARRFRSADGPAGRGPVGDGGLMVVAMPETPSAAALPGAEVEASVLRQMYPRQATILTGPEATRDRVLAVLPRSRWAHFACHATSDLANPSASNLLLFDHESEPLTVGDVARLRLDDAELAFLSGCATARTSLGLADEAVHLASGFQLAGYRHVIATLWPVPDRLAVRVAEDFYRLLDAAGLAEATAEALHVATRHIRARYPARPSAWAAYIHNGA
jgi:hypothetical protein